MKNLTKLSQVNTKNTSYLQSHRGETQKSCEMVHSWHTDLVKYEKLDKIFASKQKIFHFTRIT